MRDQDQPDDEPEDCAIVSLHELAGTKMTAEERQSTLDHGLRAVAELVQQRDSARALAWAREHRMSTVAVEETSEADWLETPVPPWEAHLLFRVPDGQLAAD